MMLGSRYAAITGDSLFGSVFTGHAQQLIVELVTIQEAEHQIITAYEVHDRRPSDITLWTPALDRHIAMFNRPPDVAANRGFGSAANEEAAIARGVRRPHQCHQTTAWVAALSLSWRGRHGTLGRPRRHCE